MTMKTLAIVGTRLCKYCICREKIIRLVDGSFISNLDTTGRCENCRDQWLKSASFIFKLARSILDKRTRP